MSWVQIVAGFVVVIGLGALGWIVKAKFDRAAEADRLELELNDVNARWKAQIEATSRADTARLKLSSELAAARLERDALFDEANRHVVKVVKDDSSCDLDVATIRLLNAARGHPATDVPAAAAGAAPPR